MKIYALYFSPTGGTKKVLDILISAWDCEKEYIDLSRSNNLSLDISFSNEDICAVAAVTRHSVIPRYGKDRPDLADVEELKQFSLKCKEMMQMSLGQADVPGHRPYRKYISVPIYPKGNKQCTNCGLCYKKCPVGAISDENYRTCDRSKCISCLQCVSACPKKARKINPVVLKIAEVKMKKLCSERKKNEIYIPDENDI